MAAKFVVVFADGQFYRDRDRRPMHFLHNATKMSRKKATAAQAARGGRVLEYVKTPAPWGGTIESVVDPVTREEHKCS